MCNQSPTYWTQSVASFHWQWLNHNILSTDMLSHGILLWPIAKQHSYLWLSLIGWSLSTKLKGHIPGTQPEAKTGNSLPLLYFTLSNSCTLFPFSDWLPTLLCHSLADSLLVFPLYSLFKLPQPHYPCLSCCVIGAGKAKQDHSRPEVIIPLWFTSWPFISMDTQLPNSVTTLETLILV